MYQLPVGDLEKVRKSRKRVKSILCNIGLESCNDLIEELKTFDAGEGSFNNTEWEDFTDGHNGKRRKKVRCTCLNPCVGSPPDRGTPSRGHVQRCHEEELDLASQSPCSRCSFIGHPSVTDRHFKVFHAAPSKTPSASSQASTPQASKDQAAATNVEQLDKYTCRSCGYHDSMIYVMKKHVLVNHYKSLLNRYFGHRSDSEIKKGGHKIANYYCKLCNFPAQTSEHLLYHLLSSVKHKELEMHIKPFLCENYNYLKNDAKALPSLAPKVAMSLVNSEVTKLPPIPPPNRNPAPATPSAGAVLLAAPGNTTALLCTAGPRPVYLPPQAPAKGLLLPGAAVAALQGGQQTPSGVPAPLPGQGVVKAAMFVPSVPQTANKPVPITVSIPSLPQAQLLPPGLQINVPGRIGLQAPQPLLVTQRMPLSQSAPRPPILASQSIRLIPTGNKVNGVPTYTLAPVQVAVPVQPSGATVVLAKNSVSAFPQPNRTVFVPVQINPGSSESKPPTHVAAVRAELSAPQARPKSKSFAAQSPFLKMENKNVKCLSCKIVLTEQGVFHHLLHGLTCLFCPLVFYSLRQIMEHSNKEHSLLIPANSELLKREFQLNTDEHGHIVFTSFDLNAGVPKEQLGDVELNLALVTPSLDKIFIKMYPESTKPTGATAAKGPCAACLLCQVKPQTKEEYDQHLKTKHHIMSTIHAILKTPAFKCIYCLGVYTDKFTPKTISVHVQRCRCAPKAVKDFLRRLYPDAELTNGAVVQVKEAVGKICAADSGQGVSAAPQSVVPRSALLLDPAGMELKSFEQRKEFLVKYFHRKPYLSKAETELLAARLWFNRTDVASIFGTRRGRCLKAIRSRRAAVLLGFNMAEVNKVRHGLLIPDVQPPTARCARVGITKEPVS
uniref:C2H2-type domain-containing protein n=1 Tax=Denticeps clupeoides TaxID=299321 RepID=A0AAY4AY50_9TELE